LNDYYDIKRVWFHICHVDLVMKNKSSYLGLLEY